MPARERNAKQSLVLADSPERERLRKLQAELEARRDDVAELDLEIETLRSELTQLEAQLEIRMSAEHAVLRRIEGLIAHLERWVELLRQAQREQVAKRARRIETRRAHQVHQEKPVEDDLDDTPPPPPPNERLKSAYRALARRFHPDLARSEEEQVRFGTLMARINELYHAGDLERLEAMVEQAKGGEVDDAEVPTSDQIKALEERLAQCNVVLANLREELAALQRSHTGLLRSKVEQATKEGRDLIEEMRSELQQRGEKAYDDVLPAIRLLEVAVRQYNRNRAEPGTALRKTKSGAKELARGFDPLTYKRLVRLSLEALESHAVSPAGRACAEALVERAAKEPAVLRLALFTYVAELSPLPLPGLESFDDLRLRFAHLSAADEPALSLEKTLVAADTLVEYGVRRADARSAHLGLRFRDPLLREAMPMALRSLAVRREFKRILSVLGEHQECPECHEQVFGIPLFRTRGLDNLRAHACPSCGHTLRSYWMPKGKDVQAVLNAAYLDFEIVSEWSFRLARASVAMQLLPVQVDTATVAALKKRLFADLFDRYALGVSPDQVQLVQGKKRVSERTHLASLDSPSFIVRFAGASLSESDAVEMLRHRVRARFQPD